MRVLAFDYGRKRIGAAVCDESESAITNLPGMSNESGQIWAKIKTIVEQTTPQLIVVGFPGERREQLTPVQNEIENFAKALQNKFAGIPVKLSDENATSQMADYFLAEIYGEKTGGKRRRRKESRQDSLAAHLILRRFLNNQSGEDDSGGG